MIQGRVGSREAASLSCLPRAQLACWPEGLPEASRSGLGFLTLWWPWCGHAALWLCGASARAFCEGSCLAPVKLGEEVPHSGPQSPDVLPSGVYSVIWDSPELYHHDFFPLFLFSGFLVGWCTSELALEFSHLFPANFPLWCFALCFGRCSDSLQNRLMGLPL